MRGRLCVCIFFGIVSSLCVIGFLHGVLHDDASPKKCWQATIPAESLRAHTVPLVGFVLAYADKWTIGPWLKRHAELFERLIVVDANDPSTEAATWILENCRKYHNVEYRTQPQLDHINDQTLREAAMRFLSTDFSELEGRWIFLGHADEFYITDPRYFVTMIEAFGSGANVIPGNPAYALPTPEERDSISAVSVANSFKTFDITHFIRHADPAYQIYEERLFKWTHGSKWGDRHSIVTPAIFSGKCVLPISLEYVHYKIHDFDLDAFTAQGDFKRSHLRTGMSHDEFGKQGPYGYYAHTGHAPELLQSMQARRCSQCVAGFRATFSSNTEKSKLCWELSSQMSKSSANQSSYEGA